MTSPADALPWAALALLSLAALVALARAWWRHRRAARAEREWRATCERYPWRVAAVMTDGAWVMLLGDDVLRAWWRDAGEPRPWETTAKETKR